jgi:lactoylglutathione lyase
MQFQADHVGISVTDMDRSLQWYQGVLGLPLRLRVRVNERTELAFLTAGETEIELVHHAGAQAAPLEGVVNHMAFRVDDIEAALQHLREHGVKILTERPMGLAAIGVQVAFFQGPDGEKLELVSPLPAR